LFGAFYPAAIAPGVLLQRFSLEDKADAPYESLSGGQKQRLALALALVNEPDILFLDEPTAGLDPQARRELQQLILRLCDEGRTVFLATHYMDEAHFLCERLAILRNGRIVAQGRPDELIARSPALSKVTLRTSMPVAVANFLATLAGISQVESAGDEVRFHTGNVGRSVFEAVRLLQRQGGELLDLQTSRPSLEDTFIDLTSGQAAA
jgi:ABC-2 type transport system ATP-binding protein